MDKAQQIALIRKTLVEIAKAEAEERMPQHVRIHNNLTGGEARSIDVRFRSWNSAQRFIEKYQHLGGMANTLQFDLFGVDGSDAPLIPTTEAGLTFVMRKLYPDWKRR